jgi:hypothetical protein
MATYAMCTIEINPKIMNHIEKIRRRVVWSKKTDEGEKCISLAAWDMVCRPKDKGGLGVLNMKTQNQGLLLKFLDKFYNKKDIQWVKLIWSTYYQDSIPHATNACGSFWWKAVMKLSPIFRGIAYCKIGKGDTALFWKDEWNHGVMQDLYPCLFSFVQNEDISVKDFCSANDISDIFHLPVSPEAFQQFQQVQHLTQQMNLSQSTNDVWTFQWGDLYTSRKYYKFVYRSISPPAPFSWIWKSKLWPKLKVFSWLLLVDRLNTRNMLKRRHLNIGNDYSCPLCSSGEEETLEHLFFSCPFSVSCWDMLNINWNGGLQRIDKIIEAKSNFQGSLFFEIFVIAAWGIWKERNNWIFKNINPSRASWKSRTIADLNLLRFKVNQNLQNTISLYISRI